MFDFSDDSGRLKPQGIWRCYDIATAIGSLGHDAGAVAHGLEHSGDQALHVFPIELVDAVLNELNAVVVGGCKGLLIVGSVIVCVG